MQPQPENTLFMLGLLNSKDVMAADDHYAPTKPISFLKDGEKRRVLELPCELSYPVIFQARSPSQHFGCVN